MLERGVSLVALSSILSSFGHTLDFNSWRQTNFWCLLHPIIYSWSFGHLSTSNGGLTTIRIFDSSCHVCLVVDCEAFYLLQTVAVPFNHFIWNRCILCLLLSADQKDWSIVLCLTHIEQYSSDVTVVRKKTCLSCFCC